MLTLWVVSSAFVALVDHPPNGCFCMREPRGHSYHSHGRRARLAVVHGQNFPRAWHNLPVALRPEEREPAPRRRRGGSSGVSLGQVPACRSKEVGGERRCLRFRLAAGLRFPHLVCGFCAIRAFGVHWRDSIRGDHLHIAASLLHCPGRPVCGGCGNGRETNYGSGGSVFPSSTLG